MLSILFLASMSNAVVDEDYIESPRKVRDANEDEIRDAAKVTVGILDYWLTLCFSLLWKNWKSYLIQAYTELLHLNEF